MAVSALFLRRLPSSADLVEALLRSSRSAVALPRHLRSRPLGTAAQLRDQSNDGDDEENRFADAVGQPRSRTSCRRVGDLFSSPFLDDVFEPFSTRSLAEGLNMMKQLADMSLVGPTRGSVGKVRRRWDAREDEEGLYLRVDMPGLGKEDVKVTVEEDTLVIEGEGPKEEDGSVERRYGGRIDLPTTLYEVGKIKAEMTNGVLKLFVPKVKEEERKGVLHVKIE